MSVYAAWDTNTEQYLRDECDDTYVRPIFSILPDDIKADDDHKSCLICHTNSVGPRWVPDNGGAWVDSNSWERSEYNHETYSGRVDEYGI